ncbi:hypothetical protein [Kocuria marina]|uniref:ImmA/IrrE family metallo-endopeptidase n=1 Tax=Kocuria marina subsp. indica TaxID=1049583 RepID=A0A1X7EA39_9MICC|nr:hypothetical protein [Kocuria indica]OXS78928.1 hypothetical protein B1B07_12365 [Kocuria indica]RLP56628.1 hypothetical protein D9R06_13140 [Kocuria indica]SMF30266.1 hypothetical protein SAMN06296028_1267 [Kocuria indica]
MFDPLALAGKHGILMQCAPLRASGGCTDGQRVWLDEHLTDLEARCALTHEIVNISRGYDRHQLAAMDDLVRAQTAWLLVPPEAITKHVGSQLDEWHLAQELGVTERMLVDRLHFASAVELQALREAGVLGWVAC